ncbi:MAG TPA: hypothetical protein VIG46_06400 [Candidatus Baltobacteraceae bacterium]|jgi:hypothetical protein
MCRSLVALAVALCCIGANTKPMSNMVALVGSWSCTTTSSFGSGHSTIVYRRLPGTDALGFSESSPQYAGSGYLGYDENVGRFFSVTADADDGSSHALGTLLPSGMLSLTGSASYGGPASPFRETLGLTDPKHLHDRSEMMKNAKWTLLDDAVCVRS